MLQFRFSHSHGLDGLDLDLRTSIDILKKKPPVFQFRKVVSVKGASERMGVFRWRETMFLSRKQIIFIFLFLKYIKSFPTT